jgi:metal-responsive CopG/Arc/MetJ family transcriptional regulator
MRIISAYFAYHHSSPPKFARFNLVLSDEMNRQIDVVVADLETKSSVIRKTLVLYLAAHRAQQEDGLQFGMFDPKTREVRREIVGL